MRKKRLRITALLMSMLLAVGMLSTAAFADNPSLPPETGSLTIHKYLMDDVTEAGNPNDGNEITTLPTGAEPLDGITFNLYKVTLPGVNAAGDEAASPVDGAYTLDSMTAPSTLTDEDGNVFSVVAASTPSVTTAGGGIATASDLPQGLYLVVEQANEAVTSSAAPFVVPVPMTNSAGDGWITDVHVYPKNEDLSVDKTPNKTSVELGETVTWTIVASIPSDIAEALAFRVTDTLDTALDYVPGTVQVEGLITKDGVGTPIVEASNWAASLDSTPAPNTLAVTFKTKGVDSPNGLAALSAYKFVKITFDTTVNEEILDRVNQTVENEANVEFTNQFDQDKERPTPKTEVHSAIINIDKTDANTGEKLAGAEFQIASSEANAKAGNYLKKIIDASDPSKVKIVDVGEDGYDAATPWVETTTATGAASFAGLKDYIDGVDGAANEYLSYWLVETKVPEGYNLMTAPVIVEFTADNSSKDTSYTVTLPVKNTKGFTLPVTGGVGTILFTVGGIALIGVAVMLFVNSRKKKQDIQ